MPYWKCYYHVVWATKYRQPMIISTYEPVIFAAIREQSQQLACSVLAINGVSDHIHVAVTIPPSLAVAKWVGSVKGASARAVNMGFNRDERFHWQEGYGVMSFGETALEIVKTYIDGQKERHANGELNTYLERIE